RDLPVVVVGEKARARVRELPLPLREARARVLALPDRRVGEHLARAVGPDEAVLAELLALRRPVLADAEVPVGAEARPARGLLALLRAGTAGLVLVARALLGSGRHRRRGRTARGTAPLPRGIVRVEVGGLAVGRADRPVGAAERAEAAVGAVVELAVAVGAARAGRGDARRTEE